jgi:hypothetical protein
LQITLYLFVLITTARLASSTLQKHHPKPQKHRAAQLNKPELQYIHIILYVHKKLALVVISAPHLLSGALASSTTLQKQSRILTRNANRSCKSNLQPQYSCVATNKMQVHQFQERKHDRTHKDCSQCPYQCVPRRHPFGKRDQAQEVEVNLTINPSN